MHMCVHLETWFVLPEKGEQSTENYRPPAPELLKNRQGHFGSQGLDCVFKADRNIEQQKSLGLSLWPGVSNATLHINTLAFFKPKEHQVCLELTASSEKQQHLEGRVGWWPLLNTFLFVIWAAGFSHSLYD